MRGATKSNGRVKLNSKDSDLILYKFNVEYVFINGLKSINKHIISCLKSWFYSMIKCIIE